MNAKTSWAANDVIPRLKERSVVTEAGCWEWQGHRSKGGYGRLSVAGRLVYASRLIAAVAHGLDYNDRSLDACHVCDNPPCVRPEHIFVGTRADNIADMDSKGRRQKPRELRATVYPRQRPCDVCGAVYEPNVNHRSRSKVCSQACLYELRRLNAQARRTV